MGIIFKAPAVLIFLICGLWSLSICFRIVEDTLGFLVAIFSLFVAPALIGIAPWYAGIIQGDWFPVVLTYGGGFLAYALFFIGGMIDGR